MRNPGVFVVSLHLDDNADSNGTHDSGEFGIIPAEERIFDGMRDGFSGRVRVMGDGFIKTDGNDLVYGLTDHSHILIVDCYPISHHFLYTITYYYTHESLHLI